jgi:hypothetical protein
MWRNGSPFLIWFELFNDAYNAVWQSFSFTLCGLNSSKIEVWFVTLNLWCRIDHTSEVFDPVTALRPTRVLSKRRCMWLVCGTIFVPSSSRFKNSPSIAWVLKVNITRSPKRRLPATQQYSVTSQKIWIIINTAVRTLNTALKCSLYVNITRLLGTHLNLLNSIKTVTHRVRVHFTVCSVTARFVSSLLSC